MKPYTLKLACYVALFSLIFSEATFAAITITQRAPAPQDQQEGYIRKSLIRFVVTEGQSQTSAQGKAAASRSMRRVVLAFNSKTVTIQNSGDNELYVKGQDQTGDIINFAKDDYTLIKQSMVEISKSTQGKPADELHEALQTALSLLAAWPANMPVLVWQDGQQTISAVNRFAVVTKPNKLAANANVKAESNLPPSVLQNPDSALHLPEIEPLIVQPLLENPPINSAPTTLLASSNTSLSLCTKMGKPVSGNYPLIAASFLPPFTKVVGNDVYTATVGGVQCLARCGAGCADSVSGVSGFGKNAYSQDCLDHDMCVTKRGTTASYCNFIFADAANDFFATPCGHDLLFVNTVVSNNPLATTQAVNLTSSGNLYAVFTIKNNSNTRLPHNKIYFDIYLDGVKKSSVQLPRILNAYDASRYYFKIPAPKAFRPGKHNLKIQINAKTLIQTATSNDVVNRAFNLL